MVLNLVRWLVPQHALGCTLFLRRWVPPLCMQHGVNESGDDALLAARWSCSARQTARRSAGGHESASVLENLQNLVREPALRRTGLSARAQMCS